MRCICTRLCYSSTPFRRSFVEETLQYSPGVPFIEILRGWHSKQDRTTTTRSHLHDGTDTSRTDTVISCYDAAEVQLLNSLYEDPMSLRLRQVLQHYSTAHFAAELGSTSLLKLLFSQGLILHTNLCGEVRESQNECYPSSVSLEKVALLYPDCSGYFLSHLASKNGHLNFLRCLVERLGPEVILTQRAPVNGQRQPQQHQQDYKTKSLDVYGIAFVYGQKSILMWLHTEHPTHCFNPFEEDALFSVQCASAHGHVRSLEYFLQLHGAQSHSILAEALYPAAEAGAENVLNFLVEALGPSIVWRPSSTGATALHHAARLGRVELLNDFFQHYNVQEHVDETDYSGRTPAMWCVMGGKKGRNIEFLRLLLELGSQWPVTTDKGECDVESFSRMCYNPSSRIRKFITKCVVSSTRKTE